MSKLRDFAPILIVICCAAVFGTLLMTGVIDLNTIPALVEALKAHYSTQR